MRVQHLSHLPGGFPPVFLGLSDRIGSAALALLLGRMALLCAIHSTVNQYGAEVVCRAEGA
jgi:hypothetical protein